MWYTMSLVFGFLVLPTYRGYTDNATPLQHTVTTVLSDSLRGLGGVSKVQEGMSKRQVQGILGSPDLSTTCGPPRASFQSYYYVRIGILVNFDQHGKVAEVLSAPWEITRDRR